MIFGNDRDELRRMYIDTFGKARAGTPLAPLEAQIAAVIDDHPEYHAELQPDAVAADFHAEDGKTNPFLHMGLHLALRDQRDTDRPPGVRALYTHIAGKFADIHDAEHRMIECLAETLWEAQGRGAPPDEQEYLEKLRELL